MTAPNWCNPCGNYHSRDDQNCVRVQEAAEEARQDRLAEKIAEKLAAILARAGRTR